MNHPVLLLSRRPEKGAVVKVEDELPLTVSQGIIGDYYSGTSRKRQVTLMQESFLQELSRIMGFEVTMAMTRRNILVRFDALTELIGKEFRLGSAVLKGTGHCRPCEKMNSTIGPGGHQAMKGRGGITACVLEDGIIHCGDVLGLT